LEGNVQEFGRGFSKFEALSDHPEGKGLHTRNGFVAIGAVAHHTGEARYFG
jgi:hypothetical protein